MVQLLRKTVERFLTKTHSVLPHDPAIMLLVVDPNVLKTDVHTKTCTQKFIAA